MKLQHQLTTGLFLSLALMLTGTAPVTGGSAGKFVQVSSSKIPGRIGTIGYVFENGHPVLAEYDSEGKWVSDLGWDDRYKEADIMSGQEYRAALQLFQQFKIDHPEYENPTLNGPAKGARFMSKEQYLATPTYQTVLEPSQTVAKPALRETTRSVLIAADNKLLTPYIKPVLLEFPILMDQNTTLEDDIVSLVIDKSEGNKGQILLKSRFQIAYKVDAYSNREELRKQDFVRRSDYELAAPLVGIQVSGDIVDWNNIQDTSDDRGEFIAAMDPELYCTFGMLGFDLHVPVAAQVPYRNFNPKKASDAVNYRPVLGYTYKGCTYVMVPQLGIYGGGTEDNIAAILAGIAMPMVEPMEILVSTMKLNGIGVLQNPDDKLDATANPDTQVALAQQTVYSANDNALQNPDGTLASADPNTLHYDFDGDGNPDNVRINPSDPRLIDVYLDRDPNVLDADGNPPEPYFTRLADRPYAPQNLHQGLLQSISRADLEDTDIYFYRQSTGDLVGHLEGLVEGGTQATDPTQSEDAGIVYTSYNGVSSYRGVHTDSAQAKFGFSSLLLGTRTRESAYYARQSLIDGGATDRTDFEQSARKPWVERYNDQAGSATDFADRKADFLIPGEKIKIIAINRKTGYIGTKITALGSPDEQQNSMDTPDENGQLERSITLYPPNLKIRVTRDYTIGEGLYKHDPDEKDRRFLIGSEGAGLTSDTAIAIQTIWLDRDGSPLPESLPGYTARIAISTGTATTGYPGGQSHLYEVKPGIHTGVVQLPGNLATAAKHYYVQLVGEPKDGNPSFESIGAGSGKLATRPKYYVPVMVPIVNEAATRNAENLLRDAKADGTAGADEKVDPIYDWVYRPEMMFSVYDWKVEEVRKTNSEGTLVNILTLDDPAISASDSVDVLYTLMEQAEPELARFSGSRDLILEIAGQEIQVQTDNNRITFVDLSYINQLAIEDYVSIRLYQNNDAYNILWEFAQIYIGVAVDLNRDGKVEFSSYEYEDNKELTGCAAVNGTTDVQPTDKTTPYRPFRFWINNDLDVVNKEGTTYFDAISCDSLGAFNTDGNQVCEIWDEDPLNGTLTNTSEGHLNIIENIRDLEDFNALALTFDNDTMQKLKDGNYHLYLKGHGVGVQLFKGSWTDEGTAKAHAFVYNKTQAVIQVTEANLVENGKYTIEKNGDEVGIPTAYINQHAVENELRFVFEGYQASDETCATDASNCYLAVSVTEHGKPLEPLSEARLYLDLHDVKDYYELASAGTAQTSSGNFEASYSGGAITSNHAVAPSHSEVEGLALFNCVAKDEVIQSTRAVLVHGWRMRDAEKTHFAESAFKRLYWTGYQGKFSAVTWPTGWFEKPAYDYDQLTSVIPFYLLGNQQNYDNSESVARRVGPDLAAWLAIKKTVHEEVFVIAHSMGNVVVSEALRQSAVPIMDGYAATNSATVAGAYYQNAGTNDVRLPVLGSLTSLNPELAWRLLNEDSDLYPDEYDMPPDVYRYNLIVNNEITHGATSNYLMKNSSIDGRSYYTGIGSKAGLIVNIYNGEDAALSTWELNQLTKPDTYDGYVWRYVNQNICYRGTNNMVRDLWPDCLLSTPDLDVVESRFFKLNNIYASSLIKELQWDSVVPITEDTADILAHLIPARTKAMGQGAVGGAEVGNTNNIELAGLTDSNQDHSAIFHGYFGDAKPRRRYWQEIMNEVFLFEIGSGDFSGLGR